MAAAQSVKQEPEDEDVHMLPSAGAQTPQGGQDLEDARDNEKIQLRFTHNEHTNNLSDKGAPLTRCYWDQSALLQSEWSEPILGKYEGLPWESTMELRNPHGLENVLAAC